jgi:lipopolysaccharide assembly outer membrane protein LptD (OstA)
LFVIIFVFNSDLKAINRKWTTISIDTLITNPTTDTLSGLTKKLDSISISAQSKNAIDEPIKYNAKDSIVYDIVNSMVYLYNGAEVFYGDINLKADYIIIDQRKKLVYAQGVKDSTGKVVGKPVFSDNGQVYNSEEMMYNFETRKGKIKEVTTNEGQGYLLADDVKKNEYDEVFIRNGKFTTCNLPHPHFYINLTKAKNITDKTVSGPAYLVVEDVPLPLAIPFGFFPRKSGRSSGILMPEIGEDRELGFFLRNGGYYFGINEFFDLALRGDIYSKGSYGFNAASRYNVKYKYNGSFNTSFTDRRFGEPNTASFIRNKDFSIRWNHNQDPKAIPGTRFSASVNIATRNNYRNNITTNIQSITQNNLNSSISFSKMWDGSPFSLSGSMTHAQNLTNGTVSLGLPNVSFNMSRIFPFEPKNRVGDQKWYHRIGVSYSADALNRISTYDSLLFKKETLKDFQNGIRHSIPISTSFNAFKYLTLSPFVNYTERWYFNSVEKNWNGESLLTDTVQGFSRSGEYNGGISMSTRIYGMYPVNKAGIVAVRHVMTPSISYSYRPDFSESSFGYYKTVQSDTTGKTSLYSIFENNNGLFGSPGGGKSSMLSYTLDNNLEMKVKKETDTGSVIKKIRLFDSFRFSGSYNMAADSLKLSDIFASARTVLFEKVNIDISAVFDLYALQADTFGTFHKVNQFEYKTNNRIARLKQASVSIGTSLNPDAFKDKNASAVKTAPKNKYDYAELEMLNRYPQYYVDWTIPWNIAINYVLSYSRPLKTSTTQQSVNFNGDVSITQKWKIGFTSGYDFTNSKITPTALNIYRDLHCWDLAINWIPFGTYQRYSVDLKVRASILQDLKLSRRREFYERN